MPNLGMLLELFSTYKSKGISEAAASDKEVLLSFPKL